MTDSFKPGDRVKCCGYTNMLSESKITSVEYEPAKVHEKIGCLAEGWIAIVFDRWPDEIHSCHIRQLEKIREPFEAWATKHGDHWTCIYPSREIAEKAGNGVVVHLKEVIE